MKKIFTYIFSFLFIIIFSIQLLACVNDSENGKVKQYTVTYVSTNYNFKDIKIIHNEGEPLKEVGITPPNPNFSELPFYSLTEDFSVDTLTPSEILPSVNEDTTVYLLWFGKKVGYINCYYEGNIVAKTLAMYYNEIWKLPSEYEGGIGSLMFPGDAKDESTIADTNSMNTYCKGYTWDGWYYDKACTQKVTLPYKITTNGDVNFYSKKGDPYSYTLNIDYVYSPYSNSSHTIKTVTKSVKYGTDLNEFLSVLPSSLSEYEIITAYGNKKPILINGNEIESKNNGWPGASNLNVKIEIVPKYSGYFEVTSSTNSSIDGKLLPYDSIETYYWDYDGISEKVLTAKPYGSTTSVAFKLSDIEGLKFKNGNSLPSQLYKHTYYSLLPNLKKIDLSEMLYLETIPQGFFYGAENIETVYAPNLPNLKAIGGGFLCYNNIKNFIFDFSNVTEIGCGFLDCAFANSAQNINIDLSNLSNISISNFYTQCGFLVNDVDINIIVKIGDYPYLDTYDFNTYGDAQCHLYQTVQTTCTANITIYSHDAVAIDAQLNSLPNITVIQY